MKHLLLYTTLALAAWLLYEAVIRPPAPVAPESSAAWLSPAEQEYYRKVFDYAMDNTDAGQSYAWKSYGGSGDISPGKPFVSKSKSACREFSEHIRVGGAEETRSGIACRREGREGWCRLEKGQALTCALETPAIQAGTEASANIGVPPVNMPSGGSGGGYSASSPNVGAPGVDTSRRNTETPKGGEIADTVTGTAGDAGAKASKGAIDWFRGTFR